MVQFQATVLHQHFNSVAASDTLKLRTSCPTHGCRHGYLRSGIRGFAIRGYKYSFPTDGAGTGPSFWDHRDRPTTGTCGLYISNNIFILILYILYGMLK